MKRKSFKNSICIVVMKFLPVFKFGASYACLTTLLWNPRSKIKLDEHLPSLRKIVVAFHNNQITRSLFPNCHGLKPRCIVWETEWWNVNTVPRSWAASQNRKPTGIKEHTHNFETSHILLTHLEHIQELKLSYHERWWIWLGADLRNMNYPVMLCYITMTHDCLVTTWQCAMRLPSSKCI